VDGLALIEWPERLGAIFRHGGWKFSYPWMATGESPG
jgi:hypothetical protein